MMSWPRQTLRGSGKYSPSPISKQSESESIVAKYESQEISFEVAAEQLKTIDIAHNAVTAACLLNSTRMECVTRNLADWPSKVRTCIFALNGEMLMATHRVMSEVLATYVEVMWTQFNNASGAIAPITYLLKRLQPTPLHLTWAHAPLLKACLLAKNYAAALPFVEPIPYQIQGADAVTAEDVLAYFYYGGNVLCGMKKWKEAVFYFGTAIAVPAQAVSAIAIESYRRYILVSFLATGTVAKIPTQASRIVSETIAKHCADYMELKQLLSPSGHLSVDESDQAHEKDRVPKLTQFIQEHVGTWQDDNTTGLVMQCVERYRRLLICDLKKIYSKISLKDVATFTGMQDAATAERYILDAVERGEVAASICQRDGVLQFQQDPHIHSSPTTTVALSQRTKSLIELDTAATQLDEFVVSSKKYISATMKRTESGTNQDVAMK